MEIPNHQKSLSWLFRENVKGVTACCSCGKQTANIASACCRNINLFFQRVLAGDGRIPCWSYKVPQCIRKLVLVLQKEYHSLLEPKFPTTMCCCLTLRAGQRNQLATVNLGNSLFLPSGRFLSFPSYESASLLNSMGTEFLGMTSDKSSPHVGIPPSTYLRKTRVTVSGLDS